MSLFSIPIGWISPEKFHMCFVCLQHCQALKIANGDDNSAIKSDRSEEQTT